MTDISAVPARYFLNVRVHLNVINSVVLVFQAISDSSPSCQIVGQFLRENFQTRQLDERLKVIGGWLNGVGD